ncbi:T9SS type A sorting domain-containing protein, partial [Phaeodactylibacter sp.]|uniref:T9SS type A sorting domain-containing protein n=1 Tax=Phaeodactylibacter sp. TaxID=1940289 RepID=UPI0025F31617
MKRLNYTLSCCLAVFAFGLFALAPAALQAQYCEGPINAADDEWITNVTFADVNHSTAFGVSTANTINATANVTTGEAVDFTVEVFTDSDFGFDEAIVIYFDFDNDFVFETSLDLGLIEDVTTAGAIFDENSAPSGSNTVTMPSTPGTYRMRVVLDFFGPVPGPCNADNTSSFKDSEDYEIVVTDGGGGGNDPTCDDGIQNGDETGVDCGGSCAPCATCDDGIQNGDETGVDCGGSCAPCQVTCESFQLTLNFDDFAAETSWQLTDLDGTLIDSDGGFSSADDFTTNVEDFCLDPGCYEFTIFDSFGDGICCDYGEGSYSLTDSDGNVIGSGGAFGGSETTFFCTDPGPDCVAPIASATVVPYCNNGVFMIMVNLGSLGSANTVTIANSGGQPALQNVFFPRRYFVGPFQAGEVVDLFIYDQENSACNVRIEGLTDNCNNSLSTPGNLTSETTLNEISVFPNPTAGDVNVNLGSIFGQEANIRIMNAVGQLIEERQIDAVENVTERFDLSNQQAGMYFIHVDVAGGESHVERVILG